MDKKTQKNLLKIVEDSYSVAAQDFNETRKKNLWPELIKLSEKVKSGESVLDVGCGNGRLYQAFRGHNIRYLGIDSSKELIEFAKTQNQNIDYQFFTADILDLKNIKDKYNHIFSIAVLHHLPGEDLQIKALKNLKNKLKDDGEIVVSVWNMWSNAWHKKGFRKKIFSLAFQKIIGKNTMDFGDVVFDWKNNQGKKLSKRYYHAFTKYGLKRLAKKSGLKIKDFYSDKYNYYITLTK